MPSKVPHPASSSTWTSSGTMSSFVWPLNLSDSIWINISHYRTSYRFSTASRDEREGRQVTHSKTLMRTTWNAASLLHKLTNRDWQMSSSLWSAETSIATITSHFTNLIWGKWSSGISRHSRTWQCSSSRSRSIAKLECHTACRCSWATKISTTHKRDTSISSSSFKTI